MQNAALGSVVAVVTNGSSCCTTVLWLLTFFLAPRVMGLSKDSAYLLFAFIISSSMLFERGAKSAVVMSPGSQRLVYLGDLVDRDFLSRCKYFSLEMRIHCSNPLPGMMTSPTHNTLDTCQ